MTTHTATSTDLLVRPSPDGLDTDAIVAMANRRYGIPYPTPHRIGWLGTVAMGECEHQVAPWLQTASPDHPNLPLIEAAMARWPEAWHAFQMLVDTFWPMDQPGVPIGRGCTSGHETSKDGRRIAYVTVGDVEGCREGLLHELAHLRLRSLGIDLETHDGALLENGTDARYVSPVRKDVLRPMSAVVHGFYAWTFMSAGDVIAMQHGKEEDVIGFIRTNTPKLMEGLITLEQHARWTQHGQPFGDALLAWGSEVVTEMKRMIPSSQLLQVWQAHRDWVAGQPVSISPLHGVTA